MREHIRGLVLQSLQRLGWSKFFCATATALTLFSLSSCERVGSPAAAFRHATASAPLALSADGQHLWVVNPDANSVSEVALSTGRVQQHEVGAEPWSVALSPFGVVVVNRASSSLSVLRGGSRTDLGIGPEPGGVALSPSGQFAYVTVSSTDEVVTVDLEAQRIVKRLPVGRLPWTIAVTNDADADDDDETLIVIHRLARPREMATPPLRASKEGWVSLIRGGRVTEASIAPYDFGFPNGLEGVAVVKGRVWVTHLLNNPELPRDFKTTVAGALSTLSLDDGAEQTTRRVPLNDENFSTPTNFPRAVAVTQDQRRAYVVLAGTNAVMGIDLSEPERPKLIGFWGVGDNPRGIVLDRAGETAYVMNYLSRDVSVLDLTDTVRYPETARIPVVPETFSPDLHRGKVLFNNANDPRLSNLGWMSCASCHLDGGSDGTTWGTPEGFRQTMPLWNLEGTAPFHASATRDEVQDFEHDIERFMDGVGLAPGPANMLLDQPNGATSADLDALAEFVLRGIRVPNAPAGDVERVAEGRAVFERAGCAECHGGPKWTVSALPGEAGRLAPNGEEEVVPVLRDVGTFNPETDTLGAHGFDPPTLLGLHATAPYLHDGSAATLGEVLENETHVGLFKTGAEEALTAFLRSIDHETRPFTPPSNDARTN